MRRVNKPTPVGQPMSFLAGLILLVGCIGIVLVFSGKSRLHAEDGDLAKFREMSNELRQRMSEDLAAATKYLESEIQKTPESADLQVLRHSLASRMLEDEDFQGAEKQFRKLLDYQIKNVAVSENQYGLWMTIQSMQDVAEESGREELLQQSITDGHEALLSLGADVDPMPLIPISQLAALRAQYEQLNDQQQAAEQRVMDQMGKLIAINKSDKATEDSWLAHIRFLKTLSVDTRSNDPWREQAIGFLDSISQAAVDAYPASVALQNDYADTQLTMITRWGQDDPDANKERIETVSNKLDLIASKNRTALAILRRIDLYQERIATAKPVESLVGKPAPEWDVDAWVNTLDLSRESLDGKVILVDFWAMWCGPCIATFPHLREWREEFADEGFEIVGATKYYGFEWDAEGKRARRAEEAGNDVERECLTKFLEHHKLEHPVLVMPEESEMSSEYGVRGIPHIVLIDRKGIVRMLKVGAAPATAKEIHAKIKELVAETPDSDNGDEKVEAKDGEKAGDVAKDKPKGKTDSDSDSKPPAKSTAEPAEKLDADSSEEKKPGSGDNDSKQAKDPSK